MTPRFKVWNTITKEWFVPTYPDQKGNKDTRECFMSQGGDLYIREKKYQEIAQEPELKVFTETVTYTPELVPCIYIGCKDESGKKIYDNDVVLVPMQITKERKTTSIAYIRIHSGSTWLASGESKFPSSETEIDSIYLQTCQVVGNILETPDYFTLLKV